MVVRWSNPIAWADTKLEQCDVGMIAITVGADHRSDYAGLWEEVPLRYRPVQRRLQGGRVDAFAEREVNRGPYKIDARI
jgi:hypothetical protein